jgi:hypothetical protein
MLLKREEKNGIIEAIYESSNILSSTYDNNTNELIITFKHGKRYKYENVSKSDYMRFETADSQGVVFNSHIKKYVFERIDDFDVKAQITEAEKLKIEEDKALLKAKELDLYSQLKFSTLFIEEGNLGSDGKIKENFIETILKLKTKIEDYVNFKNETTKK